MALSKITALPQSWTAEPDNVNTVSTADEIKQKMMDNPEHIVTFLDSLIDIFNSTTEGNSGTENLAARAITGVAGTTAYAQINDVKTQLDAAILGAIPDASLTDSKLSDAADQIKARFASHLNDYATVKAKTYANYNFSVTTTDDNGKPTQTQYEREDTTLYLQVDATNPDANSNYQNITEKYYDTDGTTLLRTITWTITYNADGLVTGRTWVVS